MTPVEFRRHLHAYPELSFREEHTADFIGKTLTAEGIEWRPVAGTGILAKIEGRLPANSRQAIVLRADIDALPVDEAVDCQWRSKNRGVMHACGHDMHAAVLFGVLTRLHHDKNFTGTVFGLFQPGEECNPGGAQAVLAENPFDSYDVKAVIGAHVEAGMPVGSFGFCAGKFMASNDELRLTVEGRGGHAAMRSKITDPVLSAAETVLRISQLNSEDCVVSTGRFIADGATNVIPDRVTTEGTMRTYDEALRAEIKRTIKKIANETDAKYGTQTAVNISEGYPCVVNDPLLTSRAIEIASESFAVVELQRRATSEDFGRYGEHYPSLFYRFGVGEDSGATHTPRFAPDEQAIDKAIAFMFTLVKRFSNE